LLTFQCQNVAMKKQIISTELAPAAIGPYSQAVKVGDTVYVSGQIGLNPKTMEIVEGGFSAQAIRVLKNLEAVAQAANSSLVDAVKLNVFVTDLANFPDLNDIMADFIPKPYPARAAVQVSALPKGAVVEIDAVLILGS